MRWIGWCLAALALAVVLMVRHQGRRALAAERRQVDEQIASRRAEADAALEQAAEGVPALQERLTSESRTAADLERQRAETEEKKVALEQAVKDLSEAAGALEQNRNDAEDKRESDQDRSRDLQARISRTETQIDALRRILPRVTPKAPGKTP